MTVVATEAAGAARAAAGARGVRSVPHSSASVGVARNLSRDLAGDGRTPGQIRAHLARKGYQPETIEAATRPETPAPSPASSAPADSPEPATPTGSSGSGGSGGSGGAGGAGGAGGLGQGLLDGARQGRGLAPRGPGGGLLLGILVYPLALAFLRGGTPRVRMWLAAKFLNRPGSAPATPGSSGKSGLGGSGSSGAGGSGSSSGSW